MESCNPEALNIILQLASTGFVSLPGGRRVEMHPSSRVIGIVTEGSVPINKTLAAYSLNIYFEAATKESTLERALSSYDIPPVSLEKLYDVYAQVRDYIQTLPQSERRLSVR